MKRRIITALAKTALWAVWLLGLAAAFVCSVAGVVQLRSEYRQVSETEVLTQLWTDILDVELDTWQYADIEPRFGIAAELWECVDEQWIEIKRTELDPWSGDGRIEFEQNFTACGENGEIVYYMLRGTFDPYAFVNAELFTQCAVTRAAYRLGRAVWLPAAAALAVSAAAFAALVHLADRPGPLHRVPYDLLVLLAVLPAAAETAAVASGRVQLSLTALMCDILLAAAVILGLALSFRVRRRCGSMVLVSAGIWRFLCRIPAVWRTLLVLIALLGTELTALLALTESRTWLRLWIPRTAVVFTAVLAAAMAMRRLAGDARALAEGDLTHVAATKGLVGDFKRHAEDLNRISGAMAREVEQRMRSERMKTELITNVSHDLKTPLTSIVNYASLIGREECENETVREYAAVLVRQSEKLKRLIEDLMEVSKAVTGNLEVVPERCGASVFVTQVGGEYGDRLAASSLTLCIQLPEEEEELYIMADSRRMWRVFDNLMGNICKYAMAHTRVYLSLAQEDGNAVFTFRNTSREPLPADPAELTERFVRGDSSRSSDGSGLGLSIAKSLTELQGGEFRLTTDGDLFKVALRFPLTAPPEDGV